MITKPGFQTVAMNGFEEIYSLTFSLEPWVRHVKDIWIAQDPAELQNGRRL
jgi:hypothetical protein